MVHRVLPQNFASNIAVRQYKCPMRLLVQYSQRSSHRAPMSTSAVFGLTMPSFPDKKEQRLESPPQRSYRDENSKITLVHSPQEFQDLLRANGDKLVVLMAKAKGCRPCRAFAKNYHAAAEHYVDSVFVEVFGDETPDTRAMMKEMQVRVTPTFVMYRNGEKMHSHGGINQKNFHSAIQEQLKAGEAGYGQWEHLIVEEDKEKESTH